MKKLCLPLLSTALLLAACGGGGSTPTTDTSAPTVSLTAVQSSTSVNLSATASDNVAVTKVEFYRGSTLVSTDTTSPYAATDTVSAANNGNVTYTAKGYNAAGNVGQDSKTVAVNVAPGGKTLYQGVWAWGIGNLVTGKLIDQGVAVFNEQGVNEGRIVAAGPYINMLPESDQPGDRLGFAFLGPITGAGRLETIFSLNTSEDDKIYFVGTDDNNVMEPYEGKPSFSGTGNVATASNQPGQQVIVVLLQASDVVPEGAGAQEVARARASTLVESAIQASFKAGPHTAQTAKQMRLNLFGAAQQVLQINR